MPSSPPPAVVWGYHGHCALMVCRHLVAVHLRKRQTHDNGFNPAPGWINGSRDGKRQG